MTEPAHSKLGASSMHRWSKCAGSVALAANIAPTTSVYAEEGTEAHRIASECLEKGLNAKDHVDVMTMLKSTEAEVRQSGDELADAVQVYLDYVRSLRRPGKDHLMVEWRFDLSSVFRGCFGTADAVIWRPDEKLLVVCDYKHGAGVPVEVVGNPQLLYYGLGALMTCGYNAAKVKLAIVQPRCGHPKGPVREDDIDALELLEFRADLIAYAKKTEAPDAPLTPGDHCRFCPAAPVCPGLRDRATAMAKLDFSPALPYDAAKLSKALAMREPIKAWVKSLDEFAYRELEQGRKIPGWKLVPKRATRKWASEGDVTDFLQDMGTKPEDIYEPRSIKSPAQMEKVPGIGKGTLDKFITKESSGHTLAPESDDRPEAVVGPAADFKALPSAVTAP